MRKKTNKILSCIICCLLASCVKDKPADINNKTPSGNGLVYLVCEGSYGSGNATLYAYKPKADSVFGDIFKIANNAVSLGDVFQSMTKIGNYFFLCINNSDKVLVLDATTYKLVNTIRIKQPRYILNVGNNKAYVSSLYTNYLTIINTQSFSVIGSIIFPCNNTEGMCQINNKAVISHWDTSVAYVSIVDVMTDAIVQNIRCAGYASQEVLIDKAQMLWVLSGNQPEGRTAALTRIDISTGAILDSFTFPKTVNPVKPVFNKTKDTLYFIEADYFGGTSNNGIFRMSIYDNKLPTSPFIPALQFQYFWALGIDPITGYIYVGDPKGFTQNGTVNIYKPDGTLINKFNVGLGPGHFCFDY